MRILLIAAAAALGAMAPAGAKAEPLAYTIDPAHTQVAFSIDRFGFNRILGRFDEVSGEIVLDEANPANSSVRALIQTGSIDSGHDVRDEHLRADRWLNAAAFPTIEFQSTSVRLIDATQAEVTGNLTLWGQTHPVTLDVTLNQIGPLPNNQRRAAGFSATGALSRAAFGHTLAQQMIGDSIAISIEALGLAPAED